MEYGLWLRLILTGTVLIENGASLAQLFVNCHSLCDSVKNIEALAGGLGRGQVVRNGLGRNGAGKVGDGINRHKLDVWAGFLSQGKLSQQIGRFFLFVDIVLYGEE